MEQKTLAYSARDQIGKGPVGRLRRTGKIPSVIYGHAGTKAISIDHHEFRATFKQISESTILTLEGDGGAHEVLVKDFQSDSLSGQILHVDFYEIEKGKLLKANVPLHLQGTPVGVREGGILEVLTHELEIECLPKDLPPHIDVDITGISAGNSIHVSDLDQVPAVRFVTSDDSVICTVQVKKAEEEVEEEEEELEEGLAEEGELEEETEATEE